MSRALNAGEIFELSKAFHALSTILGVYRYDHWDELTSKQRADLEGHQWTLFNTASDLNARSALIKVKLIQEDIDVLKATASAMQATAQKIQDIKHAIRIATKAIAFSGAVYLAATTGNVAALIPAATALMNEIGV